MNRPAPSLHRALGLCVLLTTPFSLFAAPPEPPSDLRVNDIINPVGTGADVFFGWMVNDPDDNELQTGYQILVASSPNLLSTGKADVWDSGKVSDSLQNHVVFQGKPLSSDHVYYWTARTWDKDNQSGPYSPPASFTVGLLNNADWSGADWIRRESDEADDYTCYRRQLSLSPKPVARATLYISATHKYELHLNGQLVGKGPAYEYPQYQYYNAYDVTGLLQAGQSNQLAILTHWFGGGQGRPSGARGVIAKIIVHHTDGTITELGTDASWRQTRANAWLPGQPHRNKGEGVGYVEFIDARQLLPDWDSLNFDDSQWKPATVVGPQPTAPWTGSLSPDLTRITENVIQPASITDKGNGTYVIDLGKVWAGYPQIHFSGGTRGETVTMRGGYVLNEDGLTPEGTKAQATNMEYNTILNGGEFTYRPFEYLGMRYFQIDNAPMPVTAGNFGFVVRHSVMDTTASSFESSDPTLNAVWDLMKHSLLTCAQEEFVDTPTREKGGFLGDGAIQSSMSMPVMNERPLTERVLGEFLQSMDLHWSSPENRGRINAVYPNRDGARDIPDFTQAFLSWVWHYYQETGDRAFLEAHYVRLRDVADYVARHVDPQTGLVTNLTGGAGAYLYGIIDWPSPMRFGYDMDTAARTVINSWAWLDFDVISQIAGILGNDEDRDAYRTKAESLQTAINARLLSPDGVYIDGLATDGTPSLHASQHANMFPLALGIVPDEHHASVLHTVVEDNMSVGMITVQWLIRSLGESGEGQHLIDLYTNPDWPGWARCLSRGATATWESWYSDNEHSESMSHAWGAAGLEGYTRYILGLRPLKPQYEQVLIRPLDFGRRLTWARGRIATDRGPISVNWKRDEKSCVLEVSLPDNVTATIELPLGHIAQSSALLDGQAVTLGNDGNYLRITGVGSGVHTLAVSDKMSENE